MVVNYQVEEGIAIITLNHGKANAYDPTMVADLAQVVEAVRDDHGISHAIITGNGRFFSAGADVKNYLSNSDLGEDEKAQLCADFAKVLDTIKSMDKVFVAALNGHTLGGGLELALACDSRFGREGGEYNVGFPEINLGLIPAAGGIGDLLYFAQDIDTAIKIVAEGNSFDPKTAESYGLIDGFYEGEGLTEIKERLQRGTLQKRKNDARLDTVRDDGGVSYDLLREKYGDKPQDAIEAITRIANAYLSGDKAIRNLEKSELEALYRTDLVKQELAKFRKTT